MKPTIGRIVHYVLSRHDGVHDGNGPHLSAEGQIVPAIITAVWSETCVNLLVFLDGSNHGYDQRRHPDKPGGFENIAAVNRWVTSACLSEEHVQRTWHWPPREPQDNRRPADEAPDPRMRAAGGLAPSAPAMIKRLQPIEIERPAAVTITKQSEEMAEAELQEAMRGPEAEHARDAFIAAGKRDRELLDAALEQVPNQALEIEPAKDAEGE